MLIAFKANPCRQVVMLRPVSAIFVDFLPELLVPLFQTLSPQALVPKRPSEEPVTWLAYSRPNIPNRPIEQGRASFREGDKEVEVAVKSSGSKL